LQRLFLVHLLLLLHFMLLDLVVESLVVTLLSFQIDHFHSFEVSFGMLLPVLLFLALYFLLLLFRHLIWHVNMFNMPLVDIRLFLFVPLLCINIPLLIYVKWVPVHVWSSLSCLYFADCVEILMEFIILIL
jgi:hypothetical protein